MYINSAPDSVMRVPEKQKNLNFLVTLLISSYQAQHNIMHLEIENLKKVNIVSFKLKLVYLKVKQVHIETRELSISQ